MPETLLETEGLQDGVFRREAPTQPYPGLRSFGRNEAALFFGRKKSVGRLLEILQRTRFLAVLGPSGSGKSSLVRTGLFEALEGGLDLIAGSRWLMVDIAHPADRPFHALAASMIQATTGEAAPDKAAVEALAQDLRRGPRSLIEWSQAGGLPAGHNLLVLVDQFEEMFRSAEYAAREEVEAFVDLLIESSRGSEAPIYVVMTMRSEYVGAGSQIHNLGETMTRGMYITPWMTRDECKLAITGPAKLMRFEIEPGLVNRLLNDIATFAPQDDDAGIDAAELMARQSDQLPLMQHLLNLLWREGREAAPAGKLTLRRMDYDQLGGLSGAMDVHAERVFNALGKDARKVAEDVFRAIITGSSVATAVRRPRRFGDLVEECACDPALVVEVVEAFRALDCSFLTPPPPARLTDDLIIDISHESIIRQWARLRGWVDAEATAASLWPLLLTQAREHRKGDGELLAGRTLELRGRWWAEDRPNAIWADRYGGEFELVEAFLEASRVEERRQIRRRRLMLALVPTGFIAVAVVVFVVISVMALQATNRLEDANARILAAEADLEVQNQKTLESEQKAKAAVAQSKAALAAAVAVRSSAQVAVNNAISREKNAKEMALVAVRQADDARRATTDAMELLGQYRGERAVALIGNADRLAESLDAPGMADKAAAVRAVLSTGTPTEADPPLLIRSWVISGRAEEILGRQDGATEAFAEAIEESERTRLLGMNDPSLRRARALADSYYASALMRNGQAQEALVVAERCVDEVKEDGGDEGLVLIAGCRAKVGLANARLSRDFESAFSEAKAVRLPDDNPEAVRTRLQFYLDHIEALKITRADSEKIRETYTDINRDGILSDLKFIEKSSASQIIDRDMLATVLQGYAVDTYESSMDSPRWEAAFTVLDRASALRFPKLAGETSKGLGDPPDLLGQPALVDRAFNLLNSRIDFGDPAVKFKISLDTGSTAYFANSIDALSIKAGLLPRLDIPARQEEERRIGTQLAHLSEQLGSPQFGELLLRYPGVVEAQKLFEEDLETLCDALMSVSSNLQASCVEIQRGLEVGVRAGAPDREFLEKQTAKARSSSERLWKRDGNEVALDGYDVVQYFSLEKAEAPVKGEIRYAHVWQGVVWLFSNDTNLARFIETPRAFAPQYAAGAADWMKLGLFEEANPELWLIRDGKLYLFDDDERQDWDAEAITTADEEWSGIRITEITKPKDD